MITVEVLVLYQNDNLRERLIFKDNKELIVEKLKPRTDDLWEPVFDGNVAAGIWKRAVDLWYEEMMVCAATPAVVAEIERERPHKTINTEVFRVNVREVPFKDLLKRLLAKIPHNA